MRSLDNLSSKCIENKNSTKGASESAGDTLENDVIVLDGDKLKLLVREYARECVREEMHLAYKRLF